MRRPLQRCCCRPAATMRSGTPATSASRSRRWRPNFVDLNLPSGRRKDPKGPLVASRAFRKAVPDLVASVEGSLGGGETT